MDSFRKIRGLFTGNSRDRRRNDTPYTRPDAQPASSGSTFLSYLVPRVFLHEEPVSSREDTLPQHIRKERERVYKNLEDDQQSRRVRRQRERSTRTVVKHDNVDDSKDLLEQVAAVPPAPVLNSNIFSQASKTLAVERKEASPEPVKVDEHEAFQTPRAFEIKTAGSKYHNFKGALSPAETVSKFLHAKGNAHMEAEELEGCVALLKNELQEEQDILNNPSQVETTRSAMKRPFLPSSQKITTTVPRTALFSSRKKKAPLYFGPGFGRHSAPYRKLIKPPVYNSPPSTKRARVDLHSSQKETGNLQSSIREKASPSSLRSSTLIRSSNQAQTPGKRVDLEGTFSNWLHLHKRMSNKYTN
ncbi:hypothetical protein K493DRAFT_90795 [Basidiobolus meristosporus CBS 931.73]|uniref:Uncharacterized protein n=1 Tax=Basidiobolus meristosporus CBS 931.73 TaxID=1314790 RepID=A0A1Y1YUH7_9FUNG|nr:hypothetical protein K493DRAFT_90795 [Basidiobolus meristosporus CBS 931.73]|eukprot:ORY01693.1 hypothetical protein K493DRAFT_90795 [Basidiobolus meristosporus CBS 931.73]